MKMERTRAVVSAFAAVSILLFSACFYDVDRSKIPKGDASASSDSDSDSGSDGDSGQVDGGGLRGLGEECKSSGQCDPEVADYCAIDISTQKGVCTVKDCLNSDCPDNYKCCDCTKIGYPSFCVENGSVDRLTGICPCS